MDAFDPEAPLPGPPDPWQSTDMPTRRDGPPWHMTEMIAAEPALAGRLLGALAEPGSPAAALADAVRTHARARRPILVVGCGTSEHGALAVAAILRDAARAAGLPSGLGESGSPVAVQAFEASLEPPAGGDGSALVIGVSHEGDTWATNRALDAARQAGATIGLITVSPASPANRYADIVVTTGELDQSWCHTIGYLAPVLAGSAVGSHLAGAPLDRSAAVDLLRAGLRTEAMTALEGMATHLRDASRLVVLGSGMDRIAARELTLKVEEGAHLAGAMRDLETMLHGHLAAEDDRTGLVLLLTEREARGARTARAIGVLRACRELGIRAGVIATDLIATELDPSLVPAGGVAVPDAPDLPGPVAALLATAIPLQLLTERLANARGRNPDPIRRDDPRYLAAAEAVG